MASPQAPNHDETPEVVTDQEARQGPKGRPVLMVLVGSLILAAVYMVSVMVWSGSKSPDATGSTAPTTTTLPQNPNPPPPGATGTTPKQ